MKLLVWGLFLLSAERAHGDLEKYSALIVADKTDSRPASADAIRVTYLGVNGFQFETGGHAILVDPYFTRVGLWAGAVNQQIDSNPKRVSEGLSHLRSHIDALLITHRTSIICSMRLKSCDGRALNWSPGQRRFGLSSPSRSRLTNVDS